MREQRDTSTGEVIGVVVDKNFPDELLDESLAAGVARFDDATFVIRATDARARDHLARLGVEAVEVPLVGYWRVIQRARPEAFEPTLRTTCATDQRRIWRDCEITNYTTRVIVYRDMSSETSKWWTKDGHRNDHVRVVEHGAKKKARRKKGRNLQT